MMRPGRLCPDVSCATGPSDSSKRARDVASPDVAGHQPGYLGRGQRTVEDLELVECGIQIGDAALRKLTASDPVGRRVAEITGREREIAARADRCAIDIERPDVSLSGDGDMCPSIDGQCCGAIDPLLAFHAVRRDRESRHRLLVRDPDGQEHMRKRRRAELRIRRPEVEDGGGAIQGLRIRSGIRQSRPVIHRQVDPRGDREIGQPIDETRG